MILHFGVLRYGLLDSRPAVRERIVQQLSDGIVVLDASGNIIDVNPSGQDILTSERSDVTNTSITNYVHNNSIEALLFSYDGVREILLGANAFDVTSSPLDKTDPNSDIALVFRNVTQRREDERKMKKMQRELERYAHTDALTGLKNRRLFMQRLEEESERVRRHGGELSVLLFDLDFFKTVNDTHGHDAGDKVLIAIAATTDKVKRASDVSARLGGEEFGILLPDTDQQGATHLAQRLRQAIEQMSVSLDTGIMVSITTSIGVATISRKTSELPNVLKHADNALYRAKDRGRNLVCSAEF
jgi:diguanylate cyclase (GGDEF)-like protein